MRNAITSRREAGFTLVEIAVVLLIVGILMGSFLHLYAIYKEQQKIEQTELSKVLIKFALDDYKTRYGRYPCPASYEATRDDPEYGYEGNCRDVSVLPGSCTDGYCVELSEREVMMGDGSMVVPRVRRGALPFRTLFMSEENAYDAYGGRFSYATTELLTDWRTFSVTRGGISIVDSQLPDSVSLVEPPHSALYFIFSHGKDNIGAYSRNGVLMAECGGPMFDNENCNTSPTERFAVYRSALYSEMAVQPPGSGTETEEGGGGVGGAANVNRRYDDSETYAALSGRPLWKYSEAGDPYVHDIHDILQPEQSIIIGQPPESGTVLQKLYVDGDIALTPGAEPAQAHVQSLCAQDSTDCFEPALIGGEAMNRCEFYARSIGNRRLDCGTLAEAEVHCSEEAGGRFIIGFDPETGAVRCGNIDLPDDCLERTRNLCGASRVLNRAPHNATQVLTAGASYTENWRCNDGNWQRQSTSGVCNCTAGSTTTTAPCGDGFTGNQTTTTTTVCPSGQVTTNVDRSECVCVGRDQTQNRNCPSPAVGTQTRTRAFTCTAQGSLTSGPWSEWGPACACPAQPPETETTSCPNNLSGTATRTRTLNTGTCEWSNWVNDYSNCSCQNRTDTRNVACEAPLTGSIQQQRTLTCPGATWGAWTNTVTNCSCNNRTVERTQNCPLGQIGLIRERKQVDCRGADIAGQDWQAYSNTCALPPTFYWSVEGAAQGTVNGSPRPLERGVCTTEGATGTCYRNLAPGVFTAHPCRCS